MMSCIPLTHLAHNLFRLNDSCITQHTSAVAVSLLELTSAAPVIIGQGVRFPDEVGSEMCNALIGSESQISPPLPQHLLFQHGNMRDGAFNMYNHMYKLKLHACGCSLCGGCCIMY